MLNRNCSIRRIIAFILLTCFYLTTIDNLDFFAAEIPENSDPVEIVELRQEYVKHYRIDETNMRCVVSSERIHYLDDFGIYQEIDNTIVSEVSEVGGSKYQFTNKANDIRFYFSQEERIDTFPICITYKQFALKFSFEDKTLKQVDISKKELPSALQPLVEESNFICYMSDDALLYVYAATPRGLKEYIVLTDESAINEDFSFQIKTDGLSPKLEQNIVYFTDALGNNILEMGGFWAIDSAHHYTDKIFVTLDEQESEYNVKLRLDSSWFQNDSVTYPIIIDPSVMISGETSTKDACICSYTPNTNYYVDARLRTGRDAEYGVRRSLIQFDLPAGVSSSQVTSAYIRLKRQWGVDPLLRAYPIISSWSSSSVTWNTVPSTSTEMTSLSVDDGDDWFKLDVTDFARRWIAGSLINNGVLIKDMHESSEDNWTSLYSSDSSYPNRPEFIVNYTSGSTSSNLMRYYVVASLSEEDSTCVNQVISNASSLGYLASRVTYPTAQNVYNALPDNAFTVIHGHGSASRVQMYSSNGIYSYLYATDTSSGHVCLSNYATNALAQERFIYFAVCHSTSVAQVCYQKGAACTMGFHITVSNAEDYLYYLTYYFLQGYSISMSLALADNAFAGSDYAVSDALSPARSTNRDVFGDTSFNP